VSLLAAAATSRASPAAQSPNPSTGLGLPLDRIAAVDSNAVSQPRAHEDEARPEDDLTRRNAFEATFIMKAAQNAMTEVALGIAAISRSGSDAVRKFAQTMVREHREAERRLEQIAQGKGLDMPHQLDAQHQAFVKGMRERWGAMFDSAYAAHMVSDHETAIELFKGESNAEDEDLAAYAEDTLPTLESNKRMAERLVMMAKQTTGQTFGLGPKIWY
jgi:putative membrane protein